MARSGRPLSRIASSSVADRRQDDLKTCIFLLRLFKGSTTNGGEGGGYGDRCPRHARETGATMQIVQTSREDVTMIQLWGDVTFTTRRDLSTAIEKARTPACRTILLNVEQVSFMDSAALGVLALYSNLLKAEGRRLLLLRPQERVREILTIANIPAIIPLCFSEDEVPPINEQARRPERP